MGGLTTYQTAHLYSYPAFAAGHLRAGEGEETLRQVKRDRLPEKVARQVVELIDEGRLRPGDRLFTQRELAESLSVSRVSIREALRILETMGVIEVSPGKGTFIKNPVSGSRPDWLWGAWLANYAEEVIDLYQAREALETKAAALACGRASQAEIDEMKRLNEKLAASTEGRGEEFIHVDMEFHDALARASGNRFIHKALASLAGVLNESRTAISNIPNRLARSVAEHRRLVAAIESRDPNRAELAMKEHMESIIADVRRVTGKQAGEPPA